MKIYDPIHRNVIILKGKVLNCIFNLLHNDFKFYGRDNVITIEEETKLKKGLFLIIGDKNSFNIEFVDLFDFYDLDFNSIIVIAAASDNIEFIELASEQIKCDNVFNNQMAFIVANSDEMMKLIFDYLPGVDLSKPLVNGSNYLTALIEFYLNPFTYYTKSNRKIK